MEGDFLPGHLACSANVFGVPTGLGTPRRPHLDGRELATPSKFCRGDRLAGRTDYELVKSVDALVSSASRGPRPYILQTVSGINCSRSRTGEVGFEPTILSGTPGEGVSQESCRGQLQLGKGRVVESSKPRACRDRSRVRVRVVGDCAFGWAEAANSWGATVEVLVHINLDNHLVSNTFALPL